MPTSTRRNFLAGIGTAGLSLVFPASAQSTSLEDSWHNPPRSCRPHTRWWWPGSAVSKSGIDFMLRQMNQQGLGGAEIICSWEWYQKGNIAYLSEQWFEMIRHALDRAAEFDMELALTFSPGWDLGGFWVPPEDRSKVLAPVWFDIDGPVQLNRAFPPFDASKTSRNGLWAYLTDPADEASDAHRIQAVVAARLNGDALDESTLTDLTANLSGDEISWNVPPGRWRIAAFRLEYTGQQNASQNFIPRNWIVDHYSKAALQRYCDHLTGAFRQALGSRLGTVVDSFFSDSFEVVPFRDTILWSNGILSGFALEKGYDLTRFLPALWWDIGPLTPRIRYDLNHYLSQLVLNTVYDTFRESAATVNVDSRTQPHYRFSSEIIQGSGRSPRPETEYTSARFETVADPRKATVAGARFYGSRWVSAEAYTFLHQNRYTHSLEEMKRATDAFLRDGISQIYNHGYVYSEETSIAPDRDPPFAERISHVNPWWPYYHHLAGYVARSCSLCRQGDAVADILIYSNQAQVWTERAVFNGDQRIIRYGDLPKTLLANGYDYDPINDDVLQRYARVEGKTIRVRSLSWRVLILQNVTAIPIETMRSIARLARAGAPVIALARLPELSVGLTHHEEHDAAVRRLAQELFGPDGTGIFLDKYTYLDTRPAAQPAPYSPTPPLEPRQRTLLDQLSAIVPPDFQIGAGIQSDGLTFLHRTIDGLDLYFVTNLQPQPVDTNVTFRTTGRAPERWDPRTAEIDLQIPYTTSNGRTTINLVMAPWESAFYLFRENRTSPAPKPARAVAASLPITGPWLIAIQGIEKQLPELVTWNALEGLEYISGTATYTTVFNTEVQADRMYQLDLGDVAFIAEVEFNGQPIGVAWMQPYRFDVTKQIRNGHNTLIVKVTNLLIHQVRGLKQMPPVPPELRDRYGNRREDYTNGLSALPRDQAVTPPPSGLLGPVVLHQSRRT